MIGRVSTYWHVCLVAVATLAPNNGFGQVVMLYDTLPSVSIETDKSSYDLFEPVLTVLQVTNPAAEPEEYGPLRWSAPGFNFRIRLIEPDADTAGGFAMFGREDFVLLSPTYTFRPHETRSDTFNLLLFAPVWTQTGQFTLEVSTRPDRLDFETWVQVASTNFSVAVPVGADTTAIELLSDAVSGTFDLLPWGLPPAPDFEDLLDSLASASGTTANMRELAQYVHALSADIDWYEGGRDSTDATQRYTSFLNAYPNSVYRTAVEQGFMGLRGLAGSGPYDEYRDTVDLLRLKVFLEGALQGGTMNTTLTTYSLVPLQPPYSDDPWRFSKPTELLPSTSHVTDWCLVSIIDPSADPDSLVASATGTLDEFGNLGVELRNFPRGQYYVVVDHRNHVAVMSDTLIDMTGGYAQHDFTTGHALAGVPNPQKQIVSGQDTVYAMWAGDANGDGLVAAADFDAWLQSTTAGETGYRATDFNMDRQVTALDFTKWIANTTAHAETGISDSLYNVLYPPDGGGAGLTIQSELTGPQCYVRLNVTRNTGNDYWVNVEAKTDVADKTLASITIDVFYDSSEVALESTEPGVLQDGYQAAISERVRESGHFVRVDVRATGIPTQSLGHDLGTDWEVVRKLYFSRTPPKRDAGTSIRARSLAIDFFTVHWNAGGYNGTVSSPVEIQ